MTARERVAALRSLMRREKLSAYLIPSTDPHASEYVPSCWQRRHWLSGFKGSAGDVVVTAREAGLWTDSRYFLEAEGALEPRVIKLFRKGVPGVPTIEEYLVRRLRRGDAVGFDPQLLSRSWAETLEKALSAKGIRLVFPKQNLVDAIWTDRPPLPTAPIKPHAPRFTGEPARAKVKRLRATLARGEMDAHVIAALDEIAWLFNIRGGDVDYNPFVIAYAIVTRRTAVLYVAPGKVTPGARRALRGVAELKPYTHVGRGLHALGRSRARVLIEPETTNRWILDQLRGARLVYGMSPVTRAKSVKNRSEIRGMRACQVRDGAAFSRFCHWLEGAVKRERLTECALVEKLNAIRAKERLARGPSFEAIVGFRGNGAIVHYKPEPGKDARIRKRGILLIDAGGQYLDGTTDTTRTLSIGRPTRRERELFTRVLRGHINLCRTRFPKGTKGSELEALARQPLWEGGLHYTHGTGHGVGHYLSVHEGPVAFSPRGTVPLEPGNIISLEPGCYIAGRYGFRTENLVLVMRDEDRSTKEQEWLKLEPITLCPIDRRLIERKLMQRDERDWLNRYHREVYRQVGPRLKPEVRHWLRRATRPLR
jgi:Xaa-Pro aminopeptidase